MSIFDFSIIKYLRRQKSLSRENLAKLCDVSRQTIANIENGKFVPSMPVIMALTEALDVSYPDLIAYAKRHATDVVKPSIYNFGSGNGRCFYYKLPDVSLAYLEVEEGFSYYLNNYFIQHFFVIEGNVKLDCNSHCCNASVGRFMTCRGTNGKFTVVGGPARIVIIIVPYDNQVARIIAQPESIMPENYFQQEPDKNIALSPCKRRFDFSALRTLRASLDYSLENLARESTVTVATISGIEQNKRCPSLITLNMLTSCLGVDLIEFLKFAYKSGCEGGVTRVVSMSSVDEKNKPQDMDLIQGKADNLRIGYLTNDSNQQLNVPVKNVYVAEKKFIFTLKGSETIYIDDQKYLIPQGQGLFFDGRGEHHFQVSGNHESFAVFTLHKKSAEYKAFPDDPIENLFKFGDFDQYSK